MTRLAVIAALFTTAQAGWVIGGQCPKASLVSSLDTSKWAGKWYQVASDYQNPMWLTSTCASAQYNLRNDGNVDLHFAGQTVFGPSSIDGTMYSCGQASQDWTCQATMGSSTERSPFDIVATDYDSYAIMYACFPMMFGTTSYQYVGVNSRHTQLSDDKWNQIYSIIDKAIPGYSYQSLLQKVNQDSSCKYGWKW